MAAVTSLGLHQPAGLQYAIQERLLPSAPPEKSYVWHNHADVDAQGCTENDELLVTPQCVIWSRGGVFRKSYKFDSESEPVSQAVLTTFPSFRPLAANARKASQKPGDGKQRERAIVVFLKTQAHVYFLSGTSHIIHLPFEVESASAAPNGLVIQRKLRVENPAPASLKFPRVPQNSFVSSQPQPWSAASSQYSSFSVADLGALKQMPTPQSTLKDMWDLPVLQTDANWPRLFSLSDPLAEMGLVVTQPHKAESHVHRRSSTKPATLDTAEEIIYISQRDDFSSGHSDRPLILALTLNRETSMYTVWKFSYVGNDPSTGGKQRVTSGTMSRRRSSFIPGAASGATSPVMGTQQTFRESYGGVPAGIGVKKNRQDESRDKVIDFVSSLDPDFESAELPKRKSRRVSSMLARADLSATHERSAFSELATGHQHIPKRRGDSLGSQYNRNSIGTYTGVGAANFPQSSQFGHSLNGYLEAPVDELLEELRAGGDFEGFHSMGLDDEEFDALKQEVMLTKVASVPAEHNNVRYSSQHVPAAAQCRIFTLTAPPSAADDKEGNTIVICILDPDEKKLLVLTLYTKTHRAASNLGRNAKAEKYVNVISLGPVTRAKGVLDACRIDDGDVSRILVLSETPDGYGELSLQAPWSMLMKISLPEKFKWCNTRDLSSHPSSTTLRKDEREYYLGQGPRALRGVRNPEPKGLVDLVDDEGRLHQLRILLQPRSPHVSKILKVCRIVLPGSRGGEGIWVGWWNAMQWLRLESVDSVDVEWTALIITLFSLVLGLSSKPPSVPTRAYTKRKSRHAILKPSIGILSELDNWGVMEIHEALNPNPMPLWSANAGWEWLVEEEDEMSSKKPSNLVNPTLSISDDGQASCLVRYIKLAREFVSTKLGNDCLVGCLPTSGNRSLETRNAALSSVFVGLHLLREEQKLDTMNADSFSSGMAGLTPILAQIARWLDWESWVQYYEMEEASLIDIDYDTESPIASLIPEPVPCPTIYEWIQKCLITCNPVPFMTLEDLIATQPSNLSSITPESDHWAKLTPRTLVFKHFFSVISYEWSPAQFVEALSAAGMDKILLETLPEAVLAPLQEAIVHCQTQPPTSWNEDLLAIVGREDIAVLLMPGQSRRQMQPSLIAPTHEASIDVHSICISLADAETTGSFDGSAEVDRQAVTRALFKDDRRMNEAVNILNTSRPTIARCKPQAQWSESDLLEAQKEHAQMLAYRTLAIPSGRGLLYFSARIPLLTQKWNIMPFNLSCVMKPDNNTVAADKTAFSEEKVCWAFFHAGVAAGLSISRNAKGIDTSWILFNKPVPELSNRHAGFLLALGLNGHLKNVAKWVAFKYLTTKHPMTSIGLLLGLAASHIGTMNSLITRLLSIHVTRMLPPGAAELNLSPLTQTTGIMGIGLLYCNTQHRRMSEIMVSEIEHIDTEIDEEPLRNEGYRLAAGFALGFINLGKGSDLKGLHDMHLTERLLTLAVGNKRVDLVHVLDKATAGAVVAITLIFMKSENQALARKIDVPDSILQFDYVRPDIFLLRTLARHLIMWSKIQPSFTWIEENLPKSFRARSKLDTVNELTSEDLAFYDIVTGLCFSIALRFAGSGSILVRDLLIHYLDQFIRICKIDAHTFDKKLTRNTIRNCQDLLALAVATVMAGTGDLAVFRRLRSMHGRDDNETPYGSHLAAHLAIGALFLGGGTFTFGTSNLAIAALLVAFYPIFPSTVQDNKSHLQAFRHFWALAAEERCLVARDIDTNQPVLIPVTITLKNGEEVMRNTPCLLPELHQIKSIRTKSLEYWNLVLDIEGNPAHATAFESTQTIYVRRRPAHDANTTTFQATLQALNDVGDTTLHPLEWLFELPTFSSLTKAERALVLPPDHGGSSDIHAGTQQTVVDTRLMLENATLGSSKKDRLLGLRLLFEWADQAINVGRDMQWIRREVVERLKAKVWMMTGDE